MRDKINSLHDYLPDFLKNNKEVYNILSIGIHELSEDECIVDFPILKGCIIQMLEEEIERKNKEKRDRELTASVKKRKEYYSKKDNE